MLLLLHDKQRLLQGASSAVEEALDDKDEAFDFVTALLDDTLEQADAAVDAAKRALQRGDNPAVSQVTSDQHQCIYCWICGFYWRRKLQAFHVWHGSQDVQYRLFLYTSLR